MSIYRTISFLCLLLSFLASAAHAGPSSLAVADSGELLRLRAGTYGELFSDDDDSTPVLALEIDGASGRERLLVPGTENGRVEANPILIYESGLGSAILLWKSAATNGSFRIEFATLVDAHGERRLESPGALGMTTPTRFTAAPLVAFTRDSEEVDLASGEVFAARRTVAHFVWRPKKNASALRYAALAFRDGVYDGQHEIADLGQLLGADAESVAALPEALEGVFGIGTSADERSLTVAFADSESARVGAVEVAVQPLRLSVFGELVRDEVLAASDRFDPQQIETWADIIKGGIVIIGHRLELHPAVSDFVAREIGDWIEASAATLDPDDLAALGEDAGRLAVHLAGSRMTPDPGDPTGPPEAEVLDIGKLAEDLGENARFELVLELRARSDRPAPPALEGKARIFASRDGEDLLVAWEDEDGAVRYVESRRATGGEWSEPRSLALGESLSAAAAYELLAEKIR